MSDLELFDWLLTRLALGILVVMAAIWLGG